MNAKTGIDYEGFWSEYAKNWQPGEHKNFIGDEWIGQNAGAANNLKDYVQIIEEKFVKPYISATDTVVEMGIGGGRTAEILSRYAGSLICADVSQEMINATAKRHADKNIEFIKLDGLSLNGIKDKTADVFFCYDTMVHIEPRDIFNYLTHIPRIMKGKRLCILHHTNVLSELGFRKFLAEYKDNLMGERSGGAFSVMTDTIMQKFLDHLGYTVLLRDSLTVPRDTVWVLQAPQQI
jgi:2-polyprenyl-3-methyl-5-hydroxy-6-metoxy-1,4-benzoquinol methylase